MNQNEKLKLVRNFVDKIKMPGVCGFLVLQGDDVQVIIKVDMEWMREVQARPEFIAKGMRAMLEKNIKDYLGMEVFVGSVGFDKCD